MVGVVSKTVQIYIHLQPQPKTGKEKNPFTLLHKNEKFQLFGGTSPEEKGFLYNHMFSALVKTWTLVIMIKYISLFITVK